MKPLQAIVAEPPAAYLVRRPMVVDSTVICALLFDEPERDEALRRIGGHALSAPNLIDHEVVHVALKKRGLGWPQASLSLALENYASYEIELHGTDPAAQYALAERYSLSGYDAAYLWLAAELKASLATFDRRLGEAAQRHFGSLA